MIGLKRFKTPLRNSHVRPQKKPPPMASESGLEFYTMKNNLPPNAIKSKELNAALAQDMPGLCQSLGLEGNKILSNSRTLRFGRKGSLVVEISGSQKGMWYDHEEGIGHGPLKLIERELRTDWRSARDWALNYLGWDENTSISVPQKIQQDMPVETDADTERAGKVLRAQIKYDAGLPIKNTPAEMYLKKRGIEFWPGTLRWWFNASHAYGAIVIPAFDAELRIQAIQLIYLTSEGDKAPVEVQKRSNGVLSGAAFRIPGAKPLVLAEGPETAMSIAQATGREVWAVLGVTGFKSAPILPKTEVTIAADDFAPGSQAGKSTIKAAKALAERGHKVSITSLPAGGGDFNDIHQRDGLETVRKLIDAAEELEETKVPLGVSLTEGAAKLSEALNEFVHDAVPSYALEKSFSDSNNLPIKPDWIINATTGLGKSRSANRVIAEHLSNGAGPVCVFTPTQKLSQQQALDFTDEHNIPAAVWLGLTQPDPEANDKLMCLNLELSKAAMLAGVPVKNVCKICPFKNECGYVRQQTQQAPVWFLAHEMLFFKRPPGVPKPDFIVVDEDFRQAGMAESLKLPLSALKRNPDDITNRDERRILEAGRSILARALRASMASSGCAYLTTEALVDAGVTADLALDCRDIEYRRKPSIRIVEGDIQTTISNLNKAASVFTYRIPKLWEMVSLVLSDKHKYAPGIEVCQDYILPDGSRTEMVYLSHRKSVSESWLNKPTLILDATARPEIIQQFLPNAVLRADILVSAPYEHVTWINHPFSKARLIPSGGVSERRNKSRLNNLEKLRRWIEVEASKIWPCKMLVICNLGVEKLLREGWLPDHVLISHFNDNRGVNSWAGVHWSEVGTLAVIGRTLPDPKNIQRQAEQFVGMPLEVNDEIVQAVRWLICEAELLNGGIGRGRGVHRTADNQLSIFMLNDVQLPIAYDVITNWEDAHPSASEVMAARGFLGGDTTQKGYWNIVYSVCPDLFSSPDAARVALSREQTSMNNIYIDKCSRERRGYKHRVKPKDARYSAEVDLDGCSMLTPSHRYFPEVETLEYPPCPYPPAVLNLINRKFKKSGC